MSDRGAALTARRIQHTDRESRKQPQGHSFPNFSPHNGSAATYFHFNLKPIQNTLPPPEPQSGDISSVDSQKKPRRFAHLQFPHPTGGLSTHISCIGKVFSSLKLKHGTASRRIVTFRLHWQKTMLNSLARKACRRHGKVSTSRNGTHKQTIDFIVAQKKAQKRTIFGDVSTSLLGPSRANDRTL